MSARRDAAEQIDFALRRHFSAVFTEDERVILVARIREWDEQHCHLSRSDRLSAWLEIARAERASATRAFAIAR